MSQASIYRSSTENFGSSSNIHGGRLLSTLHLPPPANPLFNHQLHHNHINLQWQQPPLLPLPISKPYRSLPARSQFISGSAPNWKPNKISRDQSPTTKKLTKQPLKRREDLKQTTPSHPNDLPKDVSRVLLPSATGVNGGGGVDDLGEFSGSVFSLSPPPSSLPLPKFPLKPKVDCKAEAARIDTGATDNLRRLLRLR